MFLLQLYLFIYLFIYLGYFILFIYIFYIILFSLFFASSEISEDWPASFLHCGLRISVPSRENFPNQAVFFSKRIILFFSKSKKRFQMQSSLAGRAWRRFRRSASVQPISKTWTDRNSVLCDVIWRYLPKIRWIAKLNFVRRSRWMWFDLRLFCDAGKKARRPSSSWWCGQKNSSLHVKNPRFRSFESRDLIFTLHP